MWQAYRRGEWCEVPEIGAVALRQLLIMAPAAEPGYPARLRLRGACVTGGLDLAEVSVPGSVRLTGCRFDAIPCFDGRGSRRWNSPAACCRV